MNEINLFEDPQILAIKNSLPAHILEDYKLKGESMFKDIDFENSSINNIIKDSAFEITELIKSGLHPSMLSEDEKAILEESMGKTWYVKFGYKEEDLKEIFTIKK
jgi:hypothetical protein